MSLVAKLLTPEHIALDLQISSKKRLFEQAGLLFENQDAVARSVVFDSLFARERLGSTGLGQGVAIPHGRIKGLKEALERAEEKQITEVLRDYGEERFAKQIAAAIVAARRSEPLDRQVLRHKGKRQERRA